MTVAWVVVGVVGLDYVELCAGDDGLQVQEEVFFLVCCSED